MRAESFFMSMAIFIVLVLVVIGLFFGGPAWMVWQQGKAGEADLARAEQDRQIAGLDAAADTVRAHGIARSNEILGKSLQGEQGERYLRWLWIDKIAGSEGDVIYVPTEAGLPILEAGRR